jgi:outer membrane immunogenic protein
VGERILTGAPIKHSVIGIAAVASLLTTSALAADMAAPVYTKAPVIPVVVYDWTGFYIGGNIGYSWDRSSTTQSFYDGPTGTTLLSSYPSSFNLDGVIGGGQIGYNWQTGALVFGIEADASKSGQSGSGAQTVPGWTSSTDINWIGTVTGRVGYAWDRVMVYGKGGFAWADEDHSQSLGGVLVSSTNASHTGWTLGLGLEYAITNNWSAKIEYNYIDLGARNVGFANVAPAPGARAVDGFDIDQTMHVVKFGVNYRFDWGAPIISRY